MQYVRPFLGTLLLITGCSLWLAPAQTTVQNPAPSELAVRGDIPAPLILKADDLARMPRIRLCSGSGRDAGEVRGVLLREILNLAGVPTGKELRGKALASYVLAKARDGYEVLFSLGEIDIAFGNESIMVADKRDGKALFGYQGPFRLVCPNDKAGARSVRMLESLELVRLQK